MNSFGLQLFYTLETSLIFSLVTVGLYLSFRILRFPDLTAEGGFGLAALLGGVVGSQTHSPFLGLCVGTLTGAASGGVTAFLANVVKLPTILASILTLTMCFSFGLLVVGVPSQPLSDFWVFSFLEGWLGSPLQAGIIGATVLLVILVGGLLLVMRTGSGFLLRVRGENPNLMRELGHSLLGWDIVGLVIANGIVGMGAVLLSQRAGYANISMGRGVAISALAAIMLAEALLPTRRLGTAFLSCIVGTFILQIVRLVALNLGIPDGGLDLVTSLLVIGLVWLARYRKTSGGNVLEQIRM
jgi:putative ABC transport system permease protein